MDYNMNEVITTILEEVKKLPDGTETSTFQLLQKLFPDLDISTKDLFEIEKMVIEYAEADGIILDKSKYDGATVGLPFHIAFVKRMKD